MPIVKRGSEALKVETRFQCQI